MSYLLLNAAMIPNEGTFTYRLLSREQAVVWLWCHHCSGITSPARSYLGYPQTAEHVWDMICDAINGHGETSGDWLSGDWLRLRPSLNRAKCTMHPGDEALVCRLAYRIDNPAAKGQPQAEDWEYGVLACRSHGGGTIWGDSPVNAAIKPIYILRTEWLGHYALDSFAFCTETAALADIPRFSEAIVAAEGVRPEALSVSVVELQLIGDVLEATE